MVSFRRGVGHVYLLFFTELIWPLAPLDYA